MRISSMTLTDFRGFKESGHSSLFIQFTSRVQIIIGANGSGKSSLLRQISLYPEKSSPFGKKGFRAQEIEYKGSSYRLEARYEKSSPTYSFFDDSDDGNLNTGHTGERQKELIAEHFAMTPLIDDLIMNRHNFPKWAPGARKEFLMAANPAQIGFVSPLIKQTQRKVRACKDNLSRLQSRKILLEQEMLDEEQFQTLSTEKAHIEKELNKIQQHVMDIEMGMRSLPSFLPAVSLQDMVPLRKLVKRYRYELSRYPHIPRSDYERAILRDQLIAERAAIAQGITTLESDMQEVMTKLSDAEIRYQDLTPDGDLPIIEATIGRLETERDKLQIAKPAFELSPSDLETAYRDWGMINDRLGVFVDRTLPLYSSKKRQHREKMLSQVQYRISSLEMRLQDLQARYAVVEKRHTLQPRDIPDSPCAKDRCPLYSHFMSEYQNFEDERVSLQYSIDRARHRLARCHLYAGKVKDYFQQSKLYHDTISWLLSQAQDRPVLHAVLKSIDILTTLSTQPYLISKRLREAYDQIEQWHKLKRVLTDLDAAYQLKSRHISLESHDTIKLVSTIDEHKNTLYKLRSRLNELLRKQGQAERDFNEVHRFDEIKKAVLTIQKEHLERLEQAAHLHEQDRLHLLKTTVDQIRAQHFLRLSDIERILRNQDSVQDRYNQEVLGQISVVEKELDELQHIEQALVAIPKEYTVHFTNAVIDQANRLIDSVWSIPLKIEPLNLDAPLTYQFIVSGDKETDRELSECSDGQTEILSLCFNLAVRIILGHADLPICLDEAGRTFDDRHKQNLTLLLKRLLDEKIISQLFLVNHHASISEGFHDCETLVLRQDNILLPERFNDHVTLS